MAAMDRLSRFALRHQSLVIVVAVLTAVAGVAATVLGFGRLTEEYAFPGLPAYEANQRIMSLYGNGGDQRPVVPVVTLPRGVTVDSNSVKASLTEAFDDVAQ